MSAELKARITPEVVEEICARSASGDGVEAIIAEMKLPPGTMEYLRDNHGQQIVDAKQIQLKARYEKEAADGVGRT